MCAPLKSRDVCGFFCKTKRTKFVKKEIDTRTVLVNSVPANGGNPTGRGGPAARMDGVRSVGPEP